MPRRRLAVWIFTLFAIGVWGAPAAAIPAFSRAYGKPSVEDMIPLIAETADAGRMAMHIGLVVVVLAIAAVGVLVSRRRRATPPTEQLDSPTKPSNPDNPA